MNIQVRNKIKPVKHSRLRDERLLTLFYESDPTETLRAAKVMISAWIKEQEFTHQLDKARDFIRETVISYWENIHNIHIRQKPLPSSFIPVIQSNLDNSVLAVADVLGKAVAQLDIIDAVHYIGSLYSSLLPDDIRSENGVFYTPPSLSAYLIEMAIAAKDHDLTQISVLDPACGSGAFLIPLAIKIADALQNEPPEVILQHVETHVKGYEIDPFAAWLSQVFLETALKNIISISQRPPGNLVTVCNSLELHTSSQEKFDIVIGNPPYGRIKLTECIASRYKQTLYGHPNLYGLFTHLAIKLTKENGILAYLTPTSFLSGEYFKNLRKFIRENTNPIEIAFVSNRKGIFESVLQETMLTTYKVGHSLKKQNSIKVKELLTSSNSHASTNEIGHFKLPERNNEPWILSRNADQAIIVQVMNNMDSRLSDWGYKVTTGQLVWNRFKNDLTNTFNRNCYPIIWAESITQNGSFQFKAEKKNHAKWFNYKTGLDFLLTKSSCVLLQRTTSKEQGKRLIAAVLPSSLIEKNKAVIVENHLNILSPIADNPQVSLEVLSIFLNSKAANDAFRTISGSVAVSAYELEALPLPKPSDLRLLSELVARNAPKSMIEEECMNLYNKK